MTLGPDLGPARLLTLTEPRDCGSLGAIASGLLSRRPTAAEGFARACPRSLPEASKTRAHRSAHAREQWTRAGGSNIWAIVHAVTPGKIQRLMPLWGLGSRHSIFWVAEKLRRFVHRWAHPNFYFFAGSPQIFFTAVR